MAQVNEIIIDVKVDAQEAAQGLTDVRGKIDALKTAQKNLAKQRQELYQQQRIGNGLTEEEAKRLEDINRAYAKNAGDLKQLTAQEKMYTGQLQLATQNNRKYGDSLTEMSAQLAQLKSEYRALSAQDREGVAGQEMLKQIQELDTTMKDADATMGDFQRNVGNYQSALLGLNGNVKMVADLFAGGFRQGISAAGVALKQFGKMILTTPVGWIAAAVALAVKVFNELKEAFQRNDDAGTALSVALSRLQPIVTAVRTAFDGLAKVVAAVIGWVTKAATAVLNLIPAYRDAANAAHDLVIAQDELEDKQRQASTEQALRNKEIAELNKEARGNENLTAQEREEIYKRMDELSRQNMEQEMQLAKEEYDNLVQSNKEKRRLSDEDKNRETEYYNKMIEAQTNYLNETTRIASREASARKEQAAEAERLRQEQERKAREAAQRAKQRRKEEEERQKEQQKNELDAARALEDAKINLIKDETEREREELRVSHERAIEDLKKRMETEKNLTETAKKSMNDQLVLMQEAMWKELAEFDQKGLKENEEKMKKMEEEAKKRYDEMTAKAKEQRKSEYEQTQQQLENEYQQRLNDLFGSAAAIAQAELEQAEKNYSALLGMDEATKNALYENEEQYKSAVIAAEREMMNAREKSSEALQTQAQEVGSTMQSVTGALSSLFEAAAEDSEQYEKFKKAMAIVDATISLATTIASATAASTAGDPYTMAIRIIANVAAVTAQFAAVIASIKAAVVPSAGSYAQGGIVGGHYYNDELTARVSSEEMILNKPQQAHLWNMIQGGAPSFGMDYRKMAQAFADGASSLPTPVLDYAEFTAFSRRVAMEDRKVAQL